MPNKDLDTLLDDFRLFHGVTCSDNVQEQTAITKQEILSLVLKALPEKRDHWADKETKDYKFGFNDSIDETEQAIRKVLG